MLLTDSESRTNSQRAMLSIPHISQSHNFLPVHSHIINNNNTPDSPSQALPSFTHSPRRMSDSAALSAPALYASQPPPDQHSHCRYNNQLTSTAFAYDPSPRPLPLYSAHIHRGASTGSLRDLRHHHAEFPPHPEWKQDIDLLDEPISPLQPNFSGGLTGSPNSAMPYSPISENPYGPSPPGTGTSTSSSVPPLNNGHCMPCSPTLSFTQHLQRSMSTPNMAAEAVDKKTYAFVALPGNAVKKRPRRRYDEIERLYQCSWPDCTKAYGTLNHLNAHVTMQKHGPKRTPDEFKEMRKQWRKAKKEQCAGAAGIMRRDSFGEAYDDSTGYDHHYTGPHAHSLHPISRSQMLQDELGLPTSVSIAGERYSVPIDDIRYPPSNEREVDTPGIGSGYSNSMLNRHRYSDGLPASWHGNSVLSRSNTVHHHHHHQHHERYESASVPHHTQLPHLAIGASMPRTMSPPPHSAPAHPHHYHHHHSSMSVHRGGGLPESGALLTTPLSACHPDASSMMPPIQNGSGPVNVIYTSEGYELYDSDSTGRPGTGHTNTSVS